MEDRMLNIIRKFGRIHKLEEIIKGVYSGELEVTNELISDLKDFILKENGEINKENAAILKKYTELKLVPRKVNTVDGPSTVFGVQYKNIGIEIGPLK